MAALFAAFLSAFTLAAHAEEAAAPEITAQGFDIADAIETSLGHSTRVRIRFEVPARIEALHIRERSFEVDLATTPERAYLPLFGIERPVRQQTDVTLNFQNYIDAKLESPGDYEFELSVTDRKGASASASLLIRVLEDEPEDKAAIEDREAEAVDRATFRLAREGAGTVSGAENLEIAWKTVESSQVVIELTLPKAQAGRFFETIAADYDRTNSRAQLSRLASNTPGASTLRLTTSRNQAAGRVFGMVKDETTYIVKVTGSTTALSEIGTTVALEGEYKY